MLSLLVSDRAPRRVNNESLICILRFFPDSSVGKESACNVGDLGSIPGLGRSTVEGKGCPLQYSGLENSMDNSMGSQSWTQLSDFHSLQELKCALFLSLTGHLAG